LEEPKNEVPTEEDLAQAGRLRRRILEAVVLELAGSLSEEKVLNVLYGLIWAQAEVVRAITRSYADGLVLMLTLSDLAEDLYRSMGEEMTPPGTESVQDTTKKEGEE